jgi:hypothetical protein
VLLIYAVDDLGEPILNGRKRERICHGQNYSQ